MRIAAGVVAILWGFGSFATAAYCVVVGMRNMHDPPVPNATILDQLAGLVLALVGVGFVLQGVFCLFTGCLILARETWGRTFGNLVGADLLMCALWFAQQSVGGILIAVGLVAMGIGIIASLAKSEHEFGYKLPRRPANGMAGTAQPVVPPP